MAAATAATTNRRLFLTLLLFLCHELLILVLCLRLKLVHQQLILVLCVRLELVHQLSIALLKLLMLLHQLLNGATRNWGFHSRAAAL